MATNNINQSTVVMATNNIPQYYCCHGYQWSTIVDIIISAEVYNLYWLWAFPTFLFWFSCMNFVSCSWILLSICNSCAWFSKCSKSCPEISYFQLHNCCCAHLKWCIHTYRRSVSSSSSSSQVAALTGGWYTGPGQGVTAPGIPQWHQRWRKDSCPSLVAENLYKVREANRKMLLQCEMGTSAGSGGDPCLSWWI